MADGFAPLLPRGGGASGSTGVFRLKILPQAAARPVFQPLPKPEAAPTAAHAHGPRSVGEPTLVLVRDGDRVSGIRIECSCGQVIELECAYEPEAKRITAGSGPAAD